MSQKSNIHFDISERKVLLRIFDIASVLSLLYVVGMVFNFDYFRIDGSRWVWSIVLALYLTVFATIFELYNLQKAAKFEIVVQNIILTSSVTVLFYLLTPFYTPELPTNRMQIIYFFLSINIALFLWRYAYIVLISAPRFFKRVLLITDSKTVVPILEALQKSDPNYKIVGFIDFDQKKENFELPYELQRYSSENIAETVATHHISEIVVATPEAQAMTIALNNQLVSLLEKGVPIREYTQVYEEITHRIPVQHVERDFYRYFPFSRS
ncbi:MAG: sugar transferase, partial [Flavobacteriaceae bacterium]|nr:sugar transferase [Flavobacteriaceae bacterium]